MQQHHYLPSVTPYFETKPQLHSSVKTKPITHTTSPIVTGSSVLGIKFKGGVMLAADTLASYGSLARYTSIERLKQVSETTVIGGGGEYSDFQYIVDKIEELVTTDKVADDGATYTPHSIYQYLSRVMYARRNKFDPLWNQIIVAGFREGKSFLGLVDLYGSHYEDNLVTTGYGSYLAQPLLRKAYTDDLSEEAARKVLEDSMRVLFYRDARALNKIQIATIDINGIRITEPFTLATQWDLDKMMANSKGDLH